MSDVVVMPQDAREVYACIDEACDSLQGALTIVEDIKVAFPRKGWAGVEKKLRRLLKETMELSWKVDSMIPEEEEVR